MSQSKARIEAENRRLTAENAELSQIVVRLVEHYWAAIGGDIEVPLPWPVECGPQPSWWWTAVAL